MELDPPTGGISDPRALFTMLGGLREAWKEAYAEKVSRRTQIWWGRWLLLGDAVDWGRVSIVAQRPDHGGSGMAERTSQGDPASGGRRREEGAGQTGRARSWENARNDRGLRAVFDLETILVSIIRNLS